MRDIIYSVTLTNAPFCSDFVLTKDTPYLALTGEIWSVFCEYFSKKQPCYEGFLLYLLNVNIYIYIYIDITWASLCLKSPANPWFIYCLCRHTSNKTSKLGISGPLWGESTGGFPSQRVSNITWQSSWWYMLPGASFTDRLAKLGLRLGHG